MSSTATFFWRRLRVKSWFNELKYFLFLVHHGIQERLLVMLSSVYLKRNLIEILAFILASPRCKLLTDPLGNYYRCLESVAFMLYQSVRVIVTFPMALCICAF